MENMTNITIPEEKLQKVLQDVETLIEDVTTLLDQDSIVKQRIAELRVDPTLGKSEQELDGYLKKRGVNIE